MACAVAIETIDATCCCHVYHVAVCCCGREWQQFYLYRPGFVLCFCGSGHFMLTFFGRGGWQHIDLYHERINLFRFVVVFEREEWQHRDLMPRFNETVGVVVCFWAE